MIGRVVKFVFIDKSAGNTRVYNMPAGFVIYTTLDTRPSFVPFTIRKDLEKYFKIPLRS